MGLSRSWVHSSGVKFVLLATIDVLYGCARWLMRKVALAAITHKRDDQGRRH
jgi:hypothetical protein